ncbi:hypothetical protein AM381_RS27855 [Raoultella ornithinolytica]|nr:hypothetical protein [Raoultella ornithinolytica]
MLIEYAIDKSTKKIMHIDQVPNGSKSNCICKACGDELVAKNAGNKNKHHFAHTNMVEKRSCLMTHLHLAMQHYFLNLKEIIIPSHSFQYKSVSLTLTAKRAIVFSSQLEKKTGNYITDIYIKTNAGDFYIEICVTHKCEPEKIAHYKTHKLNSVEITFNSNEDLTVDEWLFRLKHHDIPIEWFYYQEKENKIYELEFQLKKEEQTKYSNRIKSTQASIRDILEKKEITLPSLQHTFHYFDHGENFTTDVMLVQNKKLVLDHVELYKNTDTLFIIKGSVVRDFSNHMLWIVFSLNDTKPDIWELNTGSIIIFYFQDEDLKSDWLKYEFLERVKNNHHKLFIKSCRDKIQKKRITIYVSNQLRELSSNYVDSRDRLYNNDYKIWFQWLIKKNIFDVSHTKKWPKLPNILKEMKMYPSLWMFQRWHILIMSVLISLIDRYPVGKYISTKELFHELTLEFPLSPKFIALEKIANFEVVQYPQINVIFRNKVILSALEIFIDYNFIRVDNGKISKTTSLINILKDGLY